MRGKERIDRLEPVAEHGIFGERIAAHAGPLGTVARINEGQPCAIGKGTIVRHAGAGCPARGCEFIEFRCHIVGIGQRNDEPFGHPGAMMGGRCGHGLQRLGAVPDQAGDQACLAPEHLG